jgi:hypothetical protein
MMANKDYLIMNVEPSEYFALIEHSQWKMIDPLLKKLKEPFKSHLNGIKIGFLYNQGSRSMGMYLEKGGIKKLALDKECLEEYENEVIRRLHSKLEEKIDLLRIPQKRNSRMER